MTFGVRDLPYARTFQFGRKKGRGAGSGTGRANKRTPIPPRPLLFNNDVMENDPYFLLIEEMLGDYQQEIIEKAYKTMRAASRGG